MSHVRVLRWVNSQIVKLGGQPLDALPKGKPGFERSCPVARAFRQALGGPVETGTEATKFGRRKRGQGWYDPDDPRKKIKHPKYVQRFIERFDRRDFTDLIDR